MVDYRPIPDERDVFHEYRSYAFSPESGIPAYDPDEHETPRASLGARRGLYESDAAAVENGGGNASGDGRPRCVCRHYWLSTRVRGDSQPTAGLASVATPPEYRRHGHVRQLLARSLAEYRDRGIRFSVLWPFRYRFYRQYGWETSNEIVTHECEPADLAFATEAADPAAGAGSFRRLAADEYEALEPVYDAHAERYGLAIERDEEWWRHRVFAGHERDPFVYAYERDGQVQGYLVYTIDGEPGDRTLSVSELAFVDHGAFLALLSFCYRHESQVQRVRLRVPEDVPLREVTREPDEIETGVANGPMVRLVDVADALSALSVPDGDENREVSDASLVIAVTDPLVDWNDGTFRLTVADGQVDCERDDADHEPDATFDIAALSQLAVGARSADALERTGRLEVASSRTRDRLAALFPETDVYLGDRF